MHEIPDLEARPHTSRTKRSYAIHKLQWKLSQHAYIAGHTSLWQTVSKQLSWLDWGTLLIIQVIPESKPLINLKWKDECATATILSLKAILPRPQ